MTTWALLQVAWAGDARTPVTLTRDIELPVTAEASPWGFSDVPAVRFFAFGGRWSHRELTSPAVDDGHFLTSCRVDRHRVEMQVALAPARHPEHLPEELVCSVGSVNLVLRVVPVTALYPKAEELWPVEDVPFPLRAHPLRAGELATHTTTLGLDPAVAWVEAAVPWRPGGAEGWTPVPNRSACRVARSGDRVALLVSYTSSDQGEASCAVVDAAGTTHVFRFVRQDVPREPAPAE